MAAPAGMAPLSSITGRMEMPNTYSSFLIIGNPFVKKAEGFCFSAADLPRLFSQRSCQGSRTYSWTAVVVPSEETVITVPPLSVFSP